MQKYPTHKSAKGLEQERAAGALPSSCICVKPTIMLAPSVSGETYRAGIMHHCKCGKLDCVRHITFLSKNEGNLFCEEVGRFSKQDIQPCVCSRPLVMEGGRGVSPREGIMHHCKCGEITCATSYFKNQSKISCSRAGLFK